jgi:tetratricopeptide (TPR) repeat protein
MSNTETESALGKLENLRRGLRPPIRRQKGIELVGESLERSMEGFRLYEHGRYAEARAVFRDLAARDPRQAFHRAALGLVYLAEDALGAADRELSRSIALSDQEPSAFVTRGEVYLRLGRYADAAKDFDRAVKLIPERSDPLAKRARLLASTAREMLGGNVISPPGRKTLRVRKASVRRARKSRRK